MRATSPSGVAAYEGQVQWSGELGYGVRAPEGGQSGNRDDALTGNRPLREVFSSHLDDIDRLPDQQGMRGVANRMRARMEQRMPPQLRARIDKRNAARGEPEAPSTPTMWVSNPTTTKSDET
jgi:hypothetical protein